MSIPENLKIAIKEAGLVGSDLDDAAAFEAAFHRLDQGKIYVRICNMRRELGWSECRFNAVLVQLRADGIIQLHAGDVDTMSDEEKALGYFDEANSWQYYTLTWRGPKAAALAKANNPAMQFLTPPAPDVATVEIPPADDQVAPSESLTGHRGSQAASDGQGAAQTVHLGRIATAQERLAEAMERIAAALERPYS